MNREEIYSMNTAFCGEYSIVGYTFGQGERAACIVGSMRGNEKGQASSRIAVAIMTRVEGYSYGIQFPSSYMRGYSIPHIKMMETGHQSNSLANLFGLPYVLTGSKRAFNATTLNYNWQLRGTEAFSLYTGVTDGIDEEAAEIGVSAVLRFLTRMGIIRYNCHGGYISTILDEEELISIESEKPGFLRRIIGINTEVKRGDVLAEVIEPTTGEALSEIVAPTDGIIFFVQDTPMVFQNSVVYTMIKRLHI